MIGDGTKLNITHTGSTNLPSTTGSFLLSDILCVPKMKQNLISISKLCNSNNMSVEFLLTHFFVKDLRTGAPLVRGFNKDGVYEWPTQMSKPSVALTTIKTSPPNWHDHLGHPSKKILKLILFKFQ
ncbi:hypothetical protein PanWU01x14_247850, partial [Parasponia andersonii]